MDGIYIKGSRPKSKKQIKETAKVSPDSVSVDCTSMFGGFSGKITEMTNGQKVTFVGPDPYTKRNFYGSITRVGDSFRVE